MLHGPAGPERSDPRAGYEGFLRNAARNLPSGLPFASAPPYSGRSRTVNEHRFREGRHSGVAGVAVRNVSVPAEAHTVGSS